MTPTRPNSADSAPHHGHPTPTPQAPPAPAAPAAAHAFWSAPVHYPDAYCWYVLVCALDLMLTNTVIHHLGAIEVNALAARAIESAGFWGLIALKLATMAAFLLICETLAHRRPASARRLAEWGVAISAIPVGLTLAQLAALALANLLVT